MQQRPSSTTSIQEYKKCSRYLLHTEIKRLVCALGCMCAIRMLRTVYYRSMSATVPTMRVMQLGIELAKFITLIYCINNTLWKRHIWVYLSALFFKTEDLHLLINLHMDLSECFEPPSNLNSILFVLFTYIYIYIYI